MQQFHDSINLCDGSSLVLNSPDNSHAATLSAPSLSADTVFLLPATTGTAGQVLQAGAAGATIWVTPPVTEMAVEWLPADGATKSIPHGFGTKKVMVQVYDILSGSTIQVDSTRPDSSTVVLQSTVSPGGAGYQVLLKAFI